MQTLNQDTLNLLTTIAVIFMAPALTFMIAALLGRQLRTWGFTGYWGEGNRDMKINDF